MECWSDESVHYHDRYNAASDINNANLIGIPSAVTQVQTTHESMVAVDKTELFVVGPVEHGIFVHAVDSF